MHTEPDVHLRTGEEGCSPAHASLLELHSPLLAEGLQAARAEHETPQRTSC